MIDTTKYAGHTAGPWERHKTSSDWGMPCGIFIVNPEDNTEIAVVETITPYCIGASRKDLEKAKQAEINSILIADAPLLLAEVERLQKMVESLKCCGNCQHIYESISGDYCRINLDDDGRRTSTSPSTKCMNWESGK